MALPDLKGAIPDWSLLISIWKVFEDLGDAVSDLYPRKIPDHPGTFPFTVRTKTFKMKTIIYLMCYKENITGKTRDSFY